MSELINLDNAYSSTKSDFDSVSEWCDTVYNNNFSVYFKDSTELFERLRSKDHPITDDELQYILICLPINLYDASEMLNKMRLNQEILKITNKKREMELIAESSEKTASAKKNDATTKMIDEVLLYSAYSTIISRVENQISLSKEIIMGAKKIWDSRRKTDMSMPVGEVEELPDYYVSSDVKKNVAIYGSDSNGVC